MFFSSLKVIITTDNLITRQKYQFLQNSYICSVLPSATTWFKEHRVISLLLLVTLAIYSRFLFFGPISWDDPEMVFKNNMVRNFDLKGLFSNHFVGNYIPVTMLAHATGWFLFEDQAGGHHFINIFFHLLNGLLVYLLGRKLFNNEFTANAGALIFLLHPLQIESVGWISELKNVLSGTFYLSGLLQYVTFVQEKKKRAYWAALLCFLLGCLSKSSVVVFPLSLLCLDLLLQQRPDTRLFLNKLPFLVFSVVFGLINVYTQDADMFINHAHEFPYYQRLGFAGFALLRYLMLFLLPVQLSVIYPYPEAKIQVFLLGFGVLAAILGGLLVLFRKKKTGPAALVLFILVNLALVLQFLPFGEVLYADRYLYIPLIGLGWLSGWLLLKLRVKPVMVYLLLAMFLSVQAVSRTGAWKSAIVLYEDILKKYPDQFVALNSAGVESMFLNEDTKALEYMNRAVTVAPRNYKGFYNRGLLFLKNKQPGQAIQSFNQALALYDYAKAYTGRASAYYMLGDIAKAMNDAQLALTTDPRSAKAHFVLANCYNDLNRLDEALASYNKSIELNGQEADFYFKRAITYGKKQDFRACLDDLLLCLAINPLYYEAYYWKGVAKVNLGEDPCEDLKVAARNHFEPALNAYHKYCQ